MGFCIPSCSAPNELSFESPGKPWQGLKGKNPRLQHQSEQFWVAQKPTKGGGGLRPPPPFVGFFAPKILRTAAEGLGFFPFNPLGLARALKTGLIGG